MKKIKLFILPVIGLLLFSCSNYTDVNQNPNDILYQNLDPTELLSAAQSNTYRYQSITSNRLGNYLTNAWSGNSNIYGATIFNQPQFTLEFNSTFGNSIWDGMYLSINNFHQIANYPNPDGKYDYYTSIAKICEAHYMQYIVDLYGNSPYSQAFLTTSNTSPAYDDDQVIYRKLITNLEDAYTAILNAQNAGVAINPGAADVMLAGDMERWKDFANTVELRMLIRMSNSTGAVAAFRDQHLAVVATRNFVSSDVTINPGYANTVSQYNPYYYNFVYGSSQDSKGIGPSGHAYKSLFNDYANAASTEIVTGSGVYYPNVPDPRGKRLFKNGANSNTNKIFAVTQGAQQVDVWSVANAADAVKPLGQLGAGLSNPKNAVSATALYSANGYVMTLAESKLLQAEAKLRGYISGGDGAAASDFNDAIDASFAYLYVNNAAAQTLYKSSINTKPKFGWTGAFNDKLHAIMYQKWVALMGIHGIESYIEYVRTGYPTTPLSLTTSRLVKPNRFIYAASEYSTNSANVPNVTTSDLFTVNNFSPFWLQGDPALGN